MHIFVRLLRFGILKMGAFFLQFRASPEAITSPARVLYMLSGKASTPRVIRKKTFSGDRRHSSFNLPTQEKFVIFLSRLMNRLETFFVPESTKILQDNHRISTISRSMRLHLWWAVVPRCVSRRDFWVRVYYPMQQMFNNPKNGIYIILGYVSLAAGIVGIPVPILPTVPFVLLAAFFFSKGSPRLHHWLISHPYLGILILDWERDGVISMRTKLISTTMMVILFSITLIFVNVSLIIKSVVLMMGVSVLFFIWTRPSKKKEAEDSFSAKT